MKGFLPLAWFLACSVPAVQGGLLDLKSMIEKVTGKNALTNYGFYGCYCGWGGRGTPKDGTDRCGTCDMRSLFLAHITGRGSGGHPSHSGSKSLAWTGAVGCMTTAMGGWRRRAATFGHSPTNTDSHGAWSPAVRLGLPVQAIGRAPDFKFSCPRGQPACILLREEGLGTELG
ncbi:PREDICTED: calcium-dependent phospholipase A2 isoform X2 [Cercocebus atys]|uniref:calcium-dependent phospholipase A2 isoform X2 n=1 Tax=Cercocebus atys TaxID=9531 RepID=UPI0005F55769|nr:PREDICTED: calcium-dependent phospholipase A2 isoform X2 [Cercocebus atys]XP_011935741.1 PREDICTED: calcium-dependent phospholipase A2 isoform X2 [Cercocebus atys]XP_011935742.1 PREDICTED: calcium-dependent phospholipase A2 isoform X2 [Cercocebus atys]XP_011935743.1 PREDICTED: calcium-dependent phospholipase A2 isoform X2 [Cercocebus atys]XP_011935744.1 PREDICTED: calcium-dependent phospholipase A2 isoform X2 [Cercocebus atys]